MKFSSVNPATGKTEKSFEGPDFAAALNETKKTANAQKNWKKTDYAEKRALMKKAAQVLKRRKKEFAKIMTREMGKPITQSISEVEKCAWVCDYYAENAKKFLEKEQIKTENKKSYARFDPLGTVLAIMPWNFPFWQVFRFAAPALMAGNAGILKHASNVPASALAIEEVFESAGFPDGIFRTLLIDSKTASKLIGSEHIAAVTVTGSTGAGAKVAQLAGKNLKKCVLELGGSDPFIVLKDADVKKTVEQAVKARMINAGQSCIAAKRFIVEDEIAGEFEKEFAQKLSELKVGDPLDPKTEVGPIARADLRDDLNSQLNRSLKTGAKILTGGKKILGNGFYFEPTLLGNATEKMPVFSEETFGPLTAVFRAKDEADAVRLANKTEFGLGASVWSGKPDRAEKLAEQIDAGSVFVNKIVASDPRLPFGGIKKSGFGRELSVFGIREFVNVKTVVVG
jgi:succinate-semialdehyde dehydrogenase/glutarate-semialdehyde dehydrogenase